MYVGTYVFFFLSWVANLNGLAPKGFIEAEAFSFHFILTKLKSKTYKKNKRKCILIYYLGFLFTKHKTIFSIIYVKVFLINAVAGSTIAEFKAFHICVINSVSDGVTKLE